MKNNQTVAIETVKVAIENLNNISVGFDDLGNDVLPLQDSIVLFTDAVEKHLSMFSVKNKEAPSVLVKGPDATKDSLIKELNDAIATIEESDNAGLADIAPKAMMAIKKAADNVHAASVNLVVAAINYRVQNK